MKRFTSSFSLFSLLVFSLILLHGCNKDSAKKELYQIEYLYNIEMPGGLLPQVSHVFRFNNNPTDVNNIIDKNSMENVRSVSVISAELINMEADGGLKEIRQLESFIYPSGTDDEYYDVAYTVELPRQSRDYIQLFSSGDELKGLYQHQRMDITLRVWLWQVTQRSRKLQYRVKVGFYR